MRNPASGDPEGSVQRETMMPMQTVIETMNRLVDECAWHGVQTHASLIPYLIEETAEFIDALERGAGADVVADELGDVLYQVLFHAAIAGRDGEGYDLGIVAQKLNEKLVGRHPHVFGDRGYMSVAELNAEWQQLKEDAAGERRGSRSTLDGIPLGMPTLARAAKVVERLKRAGELRPAEEPVGATPGAPEMPESPEAIEAAEREIGDELMQLVIRANAAGIDPDRALRAATRRLADIVEE